MSAGSHMERINEALGVVFRREGFEAVDHRTPISEITQREEGEPEDEAKIREETFHRLLSFVFADGPHPGVVMRRVYAVAWALSPHLIGNMSQRELAKLFDETPAAMNWRINRMFNGYMKAAGVRGRIAGQKSAEAIRKYSQAQKGNQNRKGGKKSL